MTLRSSKTIIVLISLAILNMACSYCYLVEDISPEKIDKLETFRLHFLTVDNQEIITEKFDTRNDTLFVYEDKTIFGTMGKVNKIPLSSITWMKCCELKGENARKTGTKYFMFLGSAFLVLLLLRSLSPDNFTLSG